MKWQYLPRDRNARLAWLACELNEAALAIAMINRFGALSADPTKEQDAVKNPNNVGQLLLEMWDVEMAMRAIYPDIAQFLGEQQVKDLRAEWQSKAFPPESEVGVDPAKPTGPQVACTACEGQGYHYQSLGEKLKSKSICGICEGTGRVAAAPSEGQ